MMTLQRGAGIAPNQVMSLADNRVQPMALVTAVRSGRCHEVPPDELWSLLDSIDAHMAELAGLVNKIEEHLLATGYTPPLPDGRS